MNHSKNTIKGQPLEIGNPFQIAWIKNKQALLGGEKNCGEADWSFVRYGGHTTETGNPITHWVDKPQKADAVQMYVECPRCERKHKHVVCYDPHTLLQTEQWAQIEEMEIVCWNCGLEMYIEPDGSRMIYVKQKNETDE